MSYETNVLALDMLEEKVESSWLETPKLSVQSRETRDSLQLWKDASAAQDLVIIEGTITVSF